MGEEKIKKCHLSGNAEVVPVSEPSKKVVPLFEREKRSCQYLIITLKVVPLYDVNPRKYYSLPETQGNSVILTNCGNEKLQQDAASQSIKDAGGVACSEI